MLASLDAARFEAIRYAAAILKDEASRHKDGTDWHMEVTDERGLLLFRIDFCLTASAAVRQVKVSSEAR